MKSMGVGAGHRQFLFNFPWNILPQQEYDPSYGGRNTRGNQASLLDRMFTASKHPYPILGTEKVSQFVHRLLHEVEHEDGHAAKKVLDCLTKYFENEADKEEVVDKLKKLLKICEKDYEAAYDAWML